MRLCARRPPCACAAAAAALEALHGGGRPLSLRRQRSRRGLARAAAAAAPAAAAASPVPGVDVLAVAAKHGWDLSQQGGAERWAGDRQVRWLRVDEITRPLAGSRSNGERERLLEGRWSPLPPACSPQACSCSTCRPREGGRTYGQHLGSGAAGAD